MRKFHTRLLKRLLALGFICFIANQALAYEKSGFFVGMQGGTMGQEKTITHSQYNLDITQYATGGTTVSGMSVNTQTSVGWSPNFLGLFKPNIEIGGTAGSIFGGGSSENSSFSVTADSNVKIDVKSFFDKSVQIISDQPYSVGGVIGYKKIFSSGLNAKQYVGTNLTNHASGMRYYIAYDISAKGKKSAYSSTMVNANIDFLYNLFPDYNYFDVGGFLGVSVGWVKHRTRDYEVSGVDYGINFGVRWTIHSKHTIELFGRYGLSTLERRTANSHLESYTNKDLSSVSVSNEKQEVNGSTYDIETTADGKIYVGDVTNIKDKRAVPAYYGNDGKVYYLVYNSGVEPPNNKSGLYVSTDTDANGLESMEAYDPNKHIGQEKYEEATMRDNSGTYGYRWQEEKQADGSSIKKIILTSKQGTYNGGRIETSRQTIQEYRSFPIDTIEEFRNPMRFGIRYTYTF